MTQNTQYHPDEVTGWLDNMAGQLRAMIKQTDGDAKMLGIRTGGALVARHLHGALGLNDPAGELNISFYRDDFSQIGLHPQVGASDIPFAVDDEVIILVDDVLYSGRTIRAAMNEIFDFGRPRQIILVTLVERSDGRELPISANIVGKTLELASNQNIKLREDFSLEVVAR